MATKIKSWISWAIATDRWIKNGCYSI